MEPLNVGDLTILELSLNKFISDLDPGLECTRQCSVLMGKLEHLLAQQMAAASQLMPLIAQAGKAPIATPGQ